MRIAIFDNLANSAYIEAKGMRAAGHPVDVVCDPLDDYVMSDPRWEDLDLDLPTHELAAARLPDSPLPPWVRHQPGTLIDRTAAASSAPARALRALSSAAPIARELGMAARIAGRTGALIALSRAWVLRTLRDYDCVIAYGNGAAWAALAGVPCVSVTWGGDITMVPFYDTGDWEDHEDVPLPGPPTALFAQAKLARFGYAWAGRIILTDPRFVPFAERLGHTAKTEHLGFFIDTDAYVPGPEPELRDELLGGRDGLIVFMPSRQDWHWKGSDRLLRGFARAETHDRHVVLVCAGWGADLERSQRLIAELGIGNRVRLLSTAMSKARLRRFYRAADIVADQFTIGSYGGSALEAMSCRRPVLIHLDESRFRDRYADFPPVVNVADPDEIGAALTHLISDDAQRATVGEAARRWVVDHHGPTVLHRTLELCDAVAAAPDRRPSNTRS